MSAKINHGLYRLFAGAADQPTDQRRSGVRAEVRDGVMCGTVWYDAVRCGKEEEEEKVER